MYYMIYRNASRTGWCWQLVAKNHVAIAQSARSYATVTACERNISLVKASPDCPVYGPPMDPSKKSYFR